MKKFLFALVAVALTFAVGCKPTPDTPNGPSKNPGAESGDPVELTDFTVTLTSLHSGDVFLTIEPKQKDMQYWYSLQIKEDMPEADADVYAADLEYFNYLANYYSMSLDEFLSSNLISGDIDWRYNSLSARTEYVLYMYGLNPDGSAVTEVNRLAFTTTAVEPLDCTFEIVPADNTTATSFSVTIVPSDDTVGYFFDVFPAAMYEEYCLSDAANLPDFIKEYIPAIAAEAGYTVPVTVGAISNYGAITADFTSEEGIQPSNTYYIFAIGIGADG